VEGQHPSHPSDGGKEEQKRDKSNVHVGVGVAGGDGALAVGQGSVAVVGIIVEPVAVLVAVVVTLGAPDIATASTRRGSRALARPVDAVQPLSAAAIARGLVARAPGLAAVAVEAGLLDATAGQGEAPCLGLAIVIGAGEAEALAIGAEGASAVAADLAHATGAACRGRLLGAVAGRDVAVGGGGAVEARGRELMSEAVLVMVRGGRTDVQDRGAGMRCRRRRGRERGGVGVKGTGV